jgi:hypothetical protein
LQKGTLSVQGKHCKALAALRDQIQTPVGIFFGDRNNLGGAPNFRDPLFQGAHHAEGRVVYPTLTHHLLVSWLENVQGQRSAGKQDHVEREQRKKRHEISDIAARKS